MSTIRALNQTLTPYFPDGPKIRELILGYRIDYKKTCAICQEENSYPESVALRCEHIFHEQCITPWLSDPRKTCPICRMSPEEDPTENMSLLQREPEENGRPLSARCLSIWAGFCCVAEVGSIAWATATSGVSAVPMLLSCCIPICGFVVPIHINEERNRRVIIVD